MASNPVVDIVKLLDDEDFRDNFRGHDLYKFLRKRYIINFKGNH